MFNKVIMVGNLTKDIELRYTQSGTAIGSSSLAVNKKFKTASGEMRDETCFIDLTFWGRTAEITNQYLRKGSKILIEGELKLDRWQDQNGQNRSKHSITVSTMQMLDSKRDDSYQGGGNNSNQNQNNSERPTYQTGDKKVPVYDDRVPEIDVDEENIPF